MKKILILGNNDVGLYKFRRELIEQLIKDGNKVYISLPYGKLVNDLVEIGCEFVDTNIDRRGTNLLNDFKLILKYKSIMKKINPDFVLSYTVKPNIYGGICCRLKKIPYICNVTGLGSGYLNGGLVQKIVINLSKIAFKDARKVFFQNSSDMKMFIDHKVVNDNYSLLPGSGVNLQAHKVQPYPKESQSLNFNFIGRIMKDKGIEEYLEAAKRIKRKYSNVEFNVIGCIDQPYYEDILKEYQECGIIKYHGFQSDIITVIKSSNCTINPSYTEGMSNVLLESAACGRPIIASNIPGCKEIVCNGINGYTFEVKNVDELCICIENFIKLEYKQKKQMGLEGRLIVEKRFDRQIIVNAYMKEIKSNRESDNLKTS